MSDSDHGTSVPHPDIVELQRARSPLEAELIVSVLREAGVPAFVAGGMLADEFAVSQRLMNIHAVAIQVPRDRLDDARAALAQARANAALVEEAAEATIGPDGPERFGALVEPAARRPGWLPLVLASGAALAFLVLWLDARGQLQLLLRQSAAGPTTIDREDDDGTTWWRWTGSGEVAARVLDADRNGTAEEQTLHHVDGQRVLTLFDADQNGVHERADSWHGGSVVATSHDADQDGVFERVVEDRGTQSVVYLDQDADRRIDRIEQRDAGGALVRAWTWQPAQGLVLER